MTERRADGRLGVRRGVVASWLVLSLLPAAAAGQSAVRAGQTVHGTLDEDDQQMAEDSTFYDLYTFAGVEGQRVTIRLQASAFDAYLIVRGPGGFSEENDDADGSDSAITAVLPADGTYRIFANSNGVGTGAYALSVEAEEESSSGPSAEQAGPSAEQAVEGGGHRGGGSPVSTEETGEATAPGGERTAAATTSASSASSAAPSAGSIRVGQTVNGSLSESDPQFQDGTYRDSYTLAGRAGQAVVVRLRSSAFDPYLILRGPGGFSEENDDAGDDGQNAGLAVTLPADGSYQVMANSYGVGTGAYALSVEAVTVGSSASATSPTTTTTSPPATTTSSSAAGASAASTSSASSTSSTSPASSTSSTSSASGSSAAATSPPAGAATIRVGQTVNGSLARTDAQMSDGSYYDTYQLQVRAGQGITIHLDSNAYDTYLIVRGPGGFSDEERGIWGDRNFNALFSQHLAAAGTYTITAGSNEGGKVGAYSLSVTEFGSSGSSSSSGCPGHPGTLPSGAVCTDDDSCRSCGCNVQTGDIVPTCD